MKTLTLRSLQSREASLHSSSAWAWRLEPTDWLALENTDTLSQVGVEGLGQCLQPSTE